MSDIPEEIRKMFPNQPIHKLDIDYNGDLHILASSEPLSNEPDFENMSIEQVNQYLRDHGYDPEQVKLNGKILVEALIENLNLKSRTEAAERENLELRERTRWIPVSERLPEVDKWVSDEVLILGDHRGVNIASWVPENWKADEYVYEAGWYFRNSGKPTMGEVTHWQLLPEPPEADHD